MERIDRDALIHKYQTARDMLYQILMDYWMYIPDEDKPEIDKQLKELEL
jgi:hypothetical protein